MKIKLLAPDSASLPNSQPAPAAHISHDRDIIPLVSRILLSAIYLVSGVNKILNPAGTQEYMAANGMFWTGLFLVVAIAIELAGGLSLLLGYKTRLGAIALIIFLIPATLIFHTNFAEPIQQIMFLKNLGLLGGLLLVMQYGPGRISLDRTR
ncbi:MAG: DoxX family protein [Leptolyngbyaceae cyanobacterium SL_5_9]|nr:DoxX family protein [Leptolyngbyaceae cyanobacterium SL_5_9]NJO76867.1 DoxX family protein [Leptolyngbyaceae cyanobacterium RM1_406_9]